ncbi:GET1 [Candida pseudojiufengensis]|uniref:GET1 n=1 Tax=Candida pseudojiufengensis TaxID=497109 RepID=UPI00222518C0|nr:GET1 [Candida pseudojiufengensis]KAI5960601.1 GET1 [Candida pseudojiufengensis]
MFSIDIDPYNIILISIVVLFLQKIVSIIGKQTIQNHISNFYFTHVNKNSSFKEYTTKQHELSQLIKQQKSISAQDEYAKWTKINRSIDKLKQELIKLQEINSLEKSSIDNITKIAITIITTIPIWFLRIFCRKNALFYLRTGIFPNYLEWILALPFFKSGIIGLTCWMFCVNYVLDNLVFLIKFPFENSISKPIAPSKDEESTKVKEIK